MNRGRNFFSKILEHKVALKNDQKDLNKRKLGFGPKPKELLASF